MVARKKKKAAKPNAEYTLPKLGALPKLRVLSLDPGSKHFGIACVGMKDNKPVVLANSVLTAPLNSMVEFNSLRHVFLAEISRWINHFEPHAIVIERFQTRGNGGPLIELVSSMIGLLGGMYSHLPIRAITASTWKNAFNRRFQEELGDMYPEAEKLDLKLVYPCVKTAPHPFDASLIGVYGLEFGLKRQLHYTPKQIIKQVENTSCLPLRIIKEKRK